MPFDTSPSEPALTRRELRMKALSAATLHAAAAAASQVTTAHSTETFTQHPDAIAQPLTRREARERAAAVQHETPAVESVAVAAVPEVDAAPEPEEVASVTAVTAVAAESNESAFDALLALPELAIDDETPARPAVVRVEAPHTPRTPAVPHHTLPTPSRHRDVPDAGVSRARIPGTARRARRGPLRRLAAAGVTASMMGLAGALAVGMTLPSQAVLAAKGGSAATMAFAPGGAPVSADGEIQAFVAPSDVENAQLHRTEDYSTISRADLAAEQGIRYSDSLYTNDPTASIQWPYIVGVAMSSPFGMRDGVMHQGIDLIPGDGAPIQSIADGVVTLASESDGGYGVGVYIDHMIDGDVVTSHYGHMQYGSLRVATGDTVKVGDIIGLTGDTGRSFGAHLHIEIMVNGTIVDPLPWFLEHAGRK
ncbi:peptidoglycan DD-metalloendopeptidase family protein [Microbacterium sp. YY-01]|uniref:M23 family metallopeptidase n=1 Tax=Microbacterium sp. YY-01 TaxID=3421634 RepID=UPI003D164458